jgi:hypothetical protein
MSLSLSEISIASEIYRSTQLMCLTGSLGDKLLIDFTYLCSYLM